MIVIIEIELGVTEANTLVVKEEVLEVWEREVFEETFLEDMLEMIIITIEIIEYASRKDSPIAQVTTIIKYDA